MKPYYSDAAVTVHHQPEDGFSVLASLPDCSVDAVVTDPPYLLGFMGRAWDSHNEIDWHERWTAECLRVLKPGGHLLAFGGTRTWHRLACAVEDAGFEVRDSVAWLYGSGFPKSLDVSKAIDKQRHDTDDKLRVTWWLADVAERNGVTRADVDAHMGTSDMGGWWLSRLRHRCAIPTLDQVSRLLDVLKVAPEDVPDEIRALLIDLNGMKGQPGPAWFRREVTGRRTGAQSESTGRFGGWGNDNGRGQSEFDITAPATPDAARWQGWGSAMKPAFEPVVVARKPFKGTLAANVLTYGTGALNIDACRINASDPRPEPSTSQDSGRSSRGDSTACTCPELADDRTSHTTSTPLPASSDASPEGRSGLPANAPQGESDRPRPPGSPVGCQSSPRSGDAPVRETAGDGPASPQPRLDADTSPARCATCGRNRSTPSMPYPHDTAPHVQREVARAGRWPANVVLDESQAAALDEQSGELTSGKMLAGTRPKGERNTYSQDAASGYETQRDTPGDSGGASRFFFVAEDDDEHDEDSCPDCEWESHHEPDQPFVPFDQMGERFKYVAKADASERVRINGTAHPTVKPLTLMRWLVRLVTPPGGTVLEPFAGSGTTVEACLLEGFHCIAIEREADYLPLIRQRIHRRRDPVAAVKGSGEDGGLFDLLEGETA